MMKCTVEELRPLRQTRGLQCHPAYRLSESGGQQCPQAAHGDQNGEKLHHISVFPSWVGPCSATLL